MPAITDTYFPGVHVVERPFNPGTQSFLDVTAFGAFVGKSNQGPTTPTECRSWPQFVEHFGPNYTDLHNAVYDFFTNGGRRAYVVRIPGTGGAAASLPIYSDTTADPPGVATPLFTVTASNVGAWGNTLRVVTYVRDASNYRFDVALYKLPTATTTFDATKRNNEYLVEQWNDVSLFPNDERYLYPLVNPPSATASPIVVFNGQSYDPNASNIPANRPMPGGPATDYNLQGGVDGSYTGGYTDATEYAAAIAKLESIPGPYVLNLPNQTTAAIVKAAIQDAATRGDVFVICDPPLNKTPAEIVTYATTDLGLTGFGNIQGSFGALYYPQVYMPAIGSPTPGRTALRPAGGAITGAYMATDDAIGPWRVPAGRDYRVGGALNVERSLTESELTSLNNAHVNALRLLTGAGVSIMGARTLKKSGTDQYINVRRTIMEVTRNLISITEVELFENNDERLWERLAGSCRLYLNNILAQGGLRGGSAEQAFFVRCDETNNTPNTVAQGVVNIEVGIALLVPTEFIIITIGQYEGGIPATTSVEV